MNKFWNWTKDTDTGERVLRLDGMIKAISAKGEKTPRVAVSELHKRLKQLQL